MQVDDRYTTTKRDKFGCWLANTVLNLFCTQKYLDWLTKVNAAGVQKLFYDRIKESK